jgi:hypothetical protein
VPLIGPIKYFGRVKKALRRAHLLLKNIGLGNKLRFRGSKT